MIIDNRPREKAKTGKYPYFPHYIVVRPWILIYYIIILYLYILLEISFEIYDFLNYQRSIINYERRVKN